MIAKLFTENSLISRLCWRQKMAALNNHTVLFFVSLRAADLSHLCDAKLVLWDCCCSTDVASPPCASWPVMKEPVPPVGPRHEFCMCVCAYMYVYVCVPPVAEKAVRADIVGMCVSENREKALYLEPLRLRADGQPHTHRRLGHQRLSVGWAANEV